MASDGTTRAAVPASAKARALPPAPIGRQLINLTGPAGAVEVVADVVANQLRERAAVRVSVRNQATADLAAERGRLP